MNLQRSSSSGGREGRSKSRPNSGEGGQQKPSSTTVAARSRSRGGGGIRDARSKSRTRSKEPRVRREYHTPFDDKGRCHYHVNMQLATKKMLGGWNVVHMACPKCQEERGTDYRPISKSKVVPSGDGKTFDSNGCCVVHPHIQVAKKKIILGGGWKLIRLCPSCDAGAQTQDGGLDDNMSIKSDKSGRSNSSRKSNKSNRGGKGSTKVGVAGKATQSGRYGVALPFDADGFCCHHPSVKIAQRKLGGGFKIIHDFCPDCTKEGNNKTRGSSRTRGDRNNNGGRQKSSSPNRRRRSEERETAKDDVNDDEQTLPKMKKNNADNNLVEPTSSKSKTKRIRVKNMKVDNDDGGKHHGPGRYSGYLNDDHKPHGEGIMSYDDGGEWVGIWKNGKQERRTRRERHPEERRIM